MEFHVKTEEIDCSEVNDGDNDADIPSENGISVNSGDKDEVDFGKYSVKFCQGQYIWTEKKTFDMIRLYKEYKEKNPVGSINKKRMWDNIAAKMRALGHEKCTSSHVQNKYKTLTRQYRIVCDHNAISNNRQRTFPFMDAMSEIYEYTPSKYVRIDDADVDDDLSANQKLTSLLVNINKEKKEQEGKKLEKLEIMHREKMDIFSSFLDTINKKSSESPTPTRSSKRLSTTRKRSAPLSDDEWTSGDSDGDESSLTSPKKSEKRPVSNKEFNCKTVPQSTNELTCLITKLNEERKARDEMKMSRLEKMHDEKMKMFSAFLEVIKKIKK